jgi:hypothetical protein
MRDQEDSQFDIVHPEREELVRRLQELQWPTVRDDVRERCWQAFNARLADRLAPPADELRPRRNAGSRLEYRRRVSVPNVPPALISSGRRSWAARPQRRLTA